MKISILLNCNSKPNKQSSLFNILRDYRMKGRMTPSKIVYNLLLTTSVNKLFINDVYTHTRYQILKFTHITCICHFFTYRFCLFKLRPLMEIVKIGIIEIIFYSFRIQLDSRERFRIPFWNYLAAVSLKEWLYFIKLGASEEFYCTPKIFKH